MVVQAGKPLSWTGSVALYSEEPQANVDPIRRTRDDARQSSTLFWDDRRPSLGVLAISAGPDYLHATPHLLVGLVHLERFSVCRYKRFQGFHGTDHMGPIEKQGIGDIFAVLCEILGGSFHG
jgi:hypothetical protein